MKRHETSYQSVTVSMFAYAAMGERSQTTRDAIGISIMDGILRGHPHSQDGEALIKSAVQLTLYDNRMVFMLQNSTIEEQRGIIQFLTNEGVKLAAIDRRMVTVRGWSVQ